MSFRVTSEHVIAALHAVADEVIASKDFLCELDGAIGDGDHGIGMARAFKSIKAKLQEIDAADVYPGDILKTVGMTIISDIGGAMGPLFGGAFLRASSSVQGKETLELGDAVELMKAVETAVQERGKVQPGDKTMLDAIHPATKALIEAVDQGQDAMSAGEACINAAKQGMESTKEMVSRRGRSSRLGERTRGHQDAGATSVFIIMKTAFEALRRMSNAS